jgi:hypothetical protein
MKMLRVNFIGQEKGKWKDNRKDITAKNALQRPNTPSSGKPEFQRNAVTIHTLSLTRPTNGRAGSASEIALCRERQEWI